MTDELVELEECFYWPRGKNGKVPARIFSEQEKKDIIELTEEDQFERIECIAKGYLIDKQYYQCATINDLNHKLIEAGEYAEILLILLKDGKVFAHLQNKTQSLYSEKEAAKLANSPYSTFASAAILSDLHTIRLVSIILKEQQKKKGRRRGTGKISEKRLVVMLYQKCHEISGKRPTNNPKGMLQQLIKIFMKPLGLDSDLTSIVRQVIDERKKAYRIGVNHNILK